MAQLPQLIGVTWQAYAMIAGGLAIIYLLPRVTKAVPSPLVAILLLSILIIWLELPVNTLCGIGKLPEPLPSILLPNFPLPLEPLRIFLPSSLSFAPFFLPLSLLPPHFFLHIP